MNLTRSLVPALCLSASLLALPAGAEPASDNPPAATVQPPSPPPSPAGGEGAGGSAASPAAAPLEREGSDRIPPAVSPEASPAVSPGVGGFTVVPAPPGSDEEMLLEGLTRSFMLMDTLEGELRIQVGAPVAAVRQGEVITVMFKDLRVIDDEADGLALGDLSYRFTPDGAGAYTYDIQLADAWSLLEAGQPVARVLVGQQACKGRMGRQLLSEVECSLGGITVQGLGGEPLPQGVGFSINHARLGLTQQRVPQGDVLRGDFQVAVDGALLVGDDGTRVELGSLAMHSMIDGTPFAAWERFFARLEGLKGKAIESLSDEEVVALSLEALPLLSGAIMKSEMHIGGLKVAEAGKPLLNLDQATVLSAYDASRNLTDIHYGIAVEGLSLGLAEVPVELQPMAAAVDLTLSGLPLKGFFNGLVALAPLQGEDDPRLGQLFMEQLANKPPVLVINAVRVGGGRFDLRMNGNLETRFATLAELSMAMAAEADPAQYLAGSLHASIKGMDYLSALARRHAGDDPDVGNILLAASVVKGFGKPAGEDTFVYDIHFDPDGNLMINGTNLGQLLAALAADSPDKEADKGQETSSDTRDRDFMGDCMGFVGNEAICQCLQTQVPHLLTFKDYVQMVMNPDRFPFDSLAVQTTPEQRQFITEQVLRARDACNK